jgi:cell division septum initiation protein DivIVA
MSIADYLKELVDEIENLVRENECQRIEIESLSTELKKLKSE